MQHLPGPHVPLLPAGDSRGKVLLSRNLTVLKMWPHVSQSVVLDQQYQHHRGLVKMPFLGPHPISIELETPGMEPIDLHLQAPQAIGKYIEI